MMRMIDLEKELSGRTVFVTGADGFVGSHLCDKLVEYGADVRAFVQSTAHGNLVNISHLVDKVKIYRGDLIDKHSIDIIVKKLKDSHDKPIIFHLAAQAHVGESWERPMETLMTNVIGTFNLLQAIMDANLDIFKFDYAGTSEEYGHNLSLLAEDGVIRLNEKTPINPTSIYATSKLAGDFLALNFFHAYGMPNVVTRMFNNYGPRQSPRYVTGTIITQALSRDKIVLGNLLPRRDFCYVEDGVLGHLHVALRGKPGEVYCYGYGKDISIKDWAELILQVGEEKGFWKKNDKQIVSVKERFRPGKSDIMKLHVDYSKLHELTGWEPTVTWEEGTARTIKWYAENKHIWFGLKDW
jgi:dTDP-glucose 4,6-dehydratase